MSSERAAMHPLETMTAVQREAFIQYLDARWDCQINVQQPIWLALHLAHEKPGVLVTTPPLPFSSEKSALSDSPITAEELAELFDLFHRRWEQDILYVARTSWWLDLLPTQKEASDHVAYHRRLGCFFGYPRRDIEYFITTKSPGTKPEELVAEGIFKTDEIAFTTFVPQEHDDSITGYERAIETGKEIRTTIADCADTWNIPELETYADRLYQNALAKCSSFVFR